MSGSRWTVAGGGRRSLIALGLAGTLALSACGGSASQAPTRDPGEPAGQGEPTAPVETQAPERTEAPSEPVEAGTGSEAFAAATTALDALDSYAFRVEIHSTSTDGGTTTTSRSLMTGVVVNRPTEASTLQQAELDADGNVTSGTEIVVIGGDAWLRSSGDTDWTALPGAQASAFIASMAAFRPEQMFGTYFAGFGGSFRTVGTESKNGIETTHYQGDEAIGALLGSIAGFDGAWKSDAWIATDGGFLVHSEASADAAAGAGAGSFLILVDISDPNSAGPIEPPA
jgi:drug/metabolite transporter superfamily protein YnfA